jgi:hypothetical protein
LGFLDYQPAPFFPPLTVRPAIANFPESKENLYSFLGGKSSRSPPHQNFSHLIKTTPAIALNQNKKGTLTPSNLCPPLIPEFPIVVAASITRSKDVGVVIVTN